MGVGPGRVATNCIVRKQVLHKQEREQLFDDDYAVESEKEVKMTISKKAAASTLVCVAIALLFSCFAQPAFATMPNCKV